MRKEMKTMAIVVAFFALWLVLVNTASADLSVPSTIYVNKVFDEPKDTTDFFTTSEKFTIRNNGVNKTTYSVSMHRTVNGILISPEPSSGEIEPGKPVSVSLTITLSSTLLENKMYTREIEVKDVETGETHPIKIRITVTHKAELTVSTTSVNFDTISATESTSESVTFSERLGYKSIDVSLTGGNEWVTARPNSFKVDAGGSKTVIFSFAPRGVTRDNCVRYHSWTYHVYTEGAGSDTINLKGEICCPAKLSHDHRSSTTITFNRPKSERHTYHTTAKIRVSNTGCERMHLKSPRVTSPSGGVSLSVKNYPSYVSGYGSDYVEIDISAPYDTPEGTYYGSVYIDAGGAGHGTVDITIVIKWPVDFTVSSSSPYFIPSPPSIDFGSLALKERGYEKKSADITLTEVYGYKTVRNLRLSTSGEYGEWLHEEQDFSVIPPGMSRTFTLKIEPGLEAVPKSYSWKYDISASEISRKKMEIKAKIVPMNIPEMIEYLNSFRESPLHDSYPSSEVIISNGVEMLEAVEESEIDVDDWKKLPVLMKGTLSLLSSLNDGIAFSEEKNYGKAVENLVSASVSTSTIGSNSELNNWDISGYAKDISTGADKTTEEVLRDEAKKLELRGWNIKKAVEHAMAMDDISGLKEEENVLESALSYQYAATIYGLLNDKEKRLECVYEESLLMDKHDELVSDATDLRIKADKNIMNSREKDLIRIWNIYLLLNPYKYDTFSESYGSAEKYLENALKNYKVAGESLMSEDTEKKLKEVKSEWSYILSLFFIACILYGAAFFHTINRVIMGTVAYMRDMYEREVGDIIVK
ncbi:MAG: hypothetical protein KAV25_03930 [Methanophagales archaeon]|nr:hypothetical protein [Methanophagales archaeon]